MIRLSPLLALSSGALALALAAACGGGSESPKASPSATAAGGSLEATGSAVASEDALCGLLPPADVKGITGYGVTLVQPHQGPGFLHFCTIYLDVPGCELQCALSLEDLGRIDPNSNNSSEAYRQTLIDVNAEYGPAFTDNVAGEGSWLSTFTTGDAAGIKILYFDARDTAYDLTSPRAQGGVLTEDQMIALAKVVVQRAS